MAAGGSISDALTAAQAKVSSSADTIVISLSSGRYAENVTLDADALGVASVTIAGANVGKSLAVDISGNITTGLSTAASTVQTLYDTDNVARGVTGGALETWIDGKITVASDNVVLDGLRLHSYNGGLDFSGNDIDNFTLQNSYVTGFSGANSVRYTGDTTDGTNTGWVLKGNMIGGVSGGTGGSLYLENMSGASIEANTFFRPGAAHMYLTDTDNVTVKSNFFYHGLHADGANFDSSLADFQGAADEGYGYVGFNGDAGYGYGGYGFGYGYGAAMRRSPKWALTVDMVGTDHLGTPHQATVLKATAAAGPIKQIIFSMAVTMWLKLREIPTQSFLMATGAPITVAGSNSGMRVMRLIASIIPRSKITKCQIS